MKLKKLRTEIVKVRKHVLEAIAKHKPLPYIRGLIAEHKDLLELVCHAEESFLDEEDEVNALSERAAVGHPPAKASKRAPAATAEVVDGRSDGLVLSGD